MMPAMMTPFGVTAAPVPTVIVTATSMELVTVVATMPPLQLDQRAVLRANGTMPGLAEADTVMTSEASSAATIRTIRLMQCPSQSRRRDLRHNFPCGEFCSASLKVYEQMMLPSISCRLFPL